MKSFSFPLERVREWRSEQLDVEEGTLRALVAGRMALISRRQELLEDRRSLDLALTRAREVTAEALAALEAYRRWIKAETQRLATAILEAESRVAAQRQRVIEAQRNCRLLGKLRERALRQWWKDAGRETENLAAEIYLAKWEPG
jgi:hypothetical protein